jgi:tetratricopeptide (TPR) repeat protein
VLIELGKAPVLLILDNAETPWVADLLGVEELLGRLAGVPRLALLVTLRGNERPKGVAWLQSARPEPIKLSASRELFHSITEAKFERDPRLDSLLSALDHVPLAITLVASLAEGEPNLESIWQRWNNEHTAMLCRAGGKDRQTNMELSYELSWTGPRMTPEAKRLLQLLALLPAGLAHTDLAVVLQQGHAAASTLRKTGLAFDEVDRLRVLAPLREYVREHYPPDSEDLQRMIKHFISLATEYGQLVGENQGGTVLKRLLADAPNIEAMMMRGLSDKILTDLLIKAAPVWADYVRFSGVGSPAPFEGAAEAAKLAGDLLGQARCTWGLGNIARARADYDEAQACYERALTLFRQADYRFGQANCIFSLGEIARHCGNHQKAQVHYEEALPLYLEEDDWLGVANCTMGMGDASFACKDYFDAQTRYEDAHELYCQEQELYSQANCINRLGDIATNLGEYEVAQAHYEGALLLFRQVGHILCQGFCHFRIARLYLKLQRQPEALERFRDTLDCYEECGHPYPVGAVHYFWAQVCNEEQRDAHRQQARNSWSRLDRKELLDLAIADGLQPTEIKTLMLDSSNSVGSQVKRH